MSEEILKAGLNLLNLLNLNFNSSNYIVKLCIVSLPGISFITINAIIFFSSDMSDIDNVVNLLDSSLMIIQMLNIIRVFAVHRKTFINAIVNFNSPPPFKMLPSKNQERIKKFKKVVNIYCKCHRYISYGSMTYYVLRPLIFNEKEFPDFFSKSDMIKQSPYYEIVYSWNVINLLILLLMLMSSDMLMFALVTKLMLNIDKLKCYLKRIDFEQINTKAQEIKLIKYISKCVDYHNKLQCFAKDLGKICIPLFTVQISTAVIIICAALYNSNNKSSDSNTLGYTSIKIGGYCYELLIYLFLGTLIKYEMYSIGDAVYECNWNVKTLPSIRKSLVMIIRQSQQEISFLVFGRVKIELPSFISLMQLSFSINTLLQSLKENSK